MAKNAKRKGKTILASVTRHWLLFVVTDTFMKSECCVEIIVKKQWNSIKPIPEFVDMRSYLLWT